MLRGKKVNLRPIEERDLVSIACWRNDPRILHTFFSPFLIHPAGQQKWFENLQNDPNRLIFMIDALEGKTLGMVGLDHIDRQNQQCENGFLLMDPDNHDHHWVFEAAYLLMEYAFKGLNMHRVYSIVFADRFEEAWFEWTGWQKEVVLRQAVFMEDKFHDKVIWGVLREEWLSAEYEGTDI
jgi:diamine N-acetyltransferase